jgi:hypothetical protein
MILYRREYQLTCTSFGNTYNIHKVINHAEVSLDICTIPATGSGDFLEDIGESIEERKRASSRSNGIYRTKLLYAMAICCST